MKSIASALYAALQTLLHPKMLTMMLWPMLLAMLVWMGAAWIYWSSWISSLTEMLHSPPLEQYLAYGFIAAASHYLIGTVVVLLLLPAIYVTALLITAIFAMPMMLNHVASRRYPELERLHGGSVMGSVWNAVFATFIYLLGWLLCLPLILFTPLAAVLPILLMAYLNQRLFRYDALAEHASPAEFDTIMERATPRLYGLGALLSLLHLVPLLNLFAPVYAGLAFTHLCLAELKNLREEPFQLA